MTEKGNKTALLVIDVQNFFTIEKAADLPIKIAEHIKRSSYDHLLFTRMRYDPSSNFERILHWRGPTKSPEIDLHADIATFAAPETTFEKTTYSALKVPELLAFLRKNEIGSIDICGINIDACVLSSAFEAFDLGFNVRVLEELSSVSSMEEEYVKSAEVIIKRNLKRKD